MSKRSGPGKRASGGGAGVTGVMPARLFKALCDPNRISLIAQLVECGAPCSVGQLAGCCAVDLSVVSRHLALLREAGILESERRGREVRYSVRAEFLVRTLRAMADAIEACCPPGASSRARGDAVRIRRKVKSR